MKTNLTRRRILTASIATFAAAVSAKAQFISINGPQNYLQNFDTLGTATVGWTDGTTVPGWHAGLNANGTADGNLQATDAGPAGASALSGLLNLGTVGDANRALGSKVTSTGGFANAAYGVLFQNTSTERLRISNIGYAGELWHSNAGAGNREAWTTFFKVSNTQFTDTEPGGSAAAANVGTFTALPSLNWLAPDLNVANALLDGNLGANRVVVSDDNPEPSGLFSAIFLNPGQFFMFRWVDTNIASTDGYQGIDDVTISFSRANNMVFDRAHAGGPNGSLSVTGGNQWLLSGNPATFSIFDNAVFSQDGDSVIDVPTDIPVTDTVVSAASGTYTIGGAGRILNSVLSKSGAGTLVLTSPNTFASVSFNGGTIRPTVAGALGTAAVTLGVNGGTIDAPTDYTFTNVLAGGGTVTKTGAGTLTLSAASTHAGTTVASGALHLTGSFGNNHNISTAAGSTLRVSGTVGTGSSTGIAGRILGTGTVGGLTTVANSGTLEVGFLNAGNLTFENLRFGTAAGHTGTIDTQSGSTLFVTGNDGFTVNGGASSVTINVRGNPPIGQTALIDYTGALGGTGFGAFTLGALPNRLAATLFDNAVNSTVDLNVTGLDFPVWSGRVSTAWRLGFVGGLENWALNSDNNVGTDFRVNDNVLFSDLPLADQIVDISNGDVVVGSVTFNNSTRNYTFTGANGISGNAAVIKSGTAIVTISNINSYTGTTTINGGIIRVAALGDAGVNGSLGQGSLILAGGELEVTNAADVSNRAISSTAPSNLRVGTGNTLTLTGSVTGTGLTKVGGGTVRFGGAAPAAADVTVNEGVLQVGDGATAGTSSGAITNNAEVVFDRADNSTITSTLGGTGSYKKRGAGVLTLAGAGPATNTGDFTVEAGGIIAGKAAGTLVIGGNLILNAGTTFNFVGNNTGNQFADSATITINGGTFGNVTAPGTDPTNPGAPETVTSVVVNSGTFNTGRAVFNALTSVSVFDGKVDVHRGGRLEAGTLTVNGPGVVNLDGGSTTGGADLRLHVRTGGLVLNNGIINMNAALGSAGTGSVGSSIRLEGNVTSSGTSRINRLPIAIATAEVANFDLFGADRTFNVTGSLTIGSFTDPVTILNSQASTAGIIKTGTGTLALSGNHTFNGPVTINGGLVQFDGAPTTVAGYTVNTNGALGGVATLLGQVNLENGGAITPGLVVGGVNAGALTVNALKIGTVAGDTAAINITRGTTPAILTVTGADQLVVNGGANTVSLNLLGASPGLGQFLLVDYAGVIGGGGFSAFKLGTLPVRITAASLVDDAINSQILLDVTGVTTPVWTGAATNEWSLQTIAAPKNWKLSTGPGAGTDFLALDDVLFDDTALPAGTGVDISIEDVNPSSVRFNNSTLDYTIGGSRAISGPATLVKDGTAKATIQTTNTFTGPVTINAGTLSVAFMSDTGVAGPLGAGNLITLNGGTLEVTTGTSSNRPISVDATSTISTGGLVVLNGAITGAGALTKTGTGSLVLGGTNTVANLTVQQGTLFVGAAANFAPTTSLNGGTLEYTGTAAATLGAKVINVAAAGGTIRIPTATAAITLDTAGTFTGTGTTTLEGTGVLRVQVPNPGYTGNWILNGGALEAQFADALGSGTVTVNAGATLTTQSKAAPNNYSLQNNITLAGGNLQVRSGDFGTFGGTVNVTAPSMVTLRSYTTTGAAQNLTITGLLEGNQPLSVTGNDPQNQARALFLTNTANTFSGGFIVASGQAIAAQPTTTGSPFGTSGVTLNDASFVVFDSGTGNDGIITYGTNITVAGLVGSRLQLGAGPTAVTGNTVRLGTLTMTGPLLTTTSGTPVGGLPGADRYTAEFTGAATLPAAVTITNTSADLIFSGSLTGAGAISKSGPNELSLNGISTIAGDITVLQGLLEVNGEIVDGTNVFLSGLNGAAALGGTGILSDNATLQAANTSIAPGNGGAGILSVEENVTFFAGSAFTLDISRGLAPTPVAGTDYDRLTVGTGVGALSTGAVDITGANLLLNVAPGAYATGDQFFLLLNDGTDAITGTFANIPAPGTAFFVNGVEFEISYEADFATNSMTGGNDIALVVPEPGSAALLLGGLALLAARRRRKE